MGRAYGLFPGECYMKITLQAAMGRMEKFRQFRREAILVPRRDDELWLRM